MMKVQVSTDHQGTKAVLDGNFDEQVDLSTLIGPPASTLNVFCGGIKRFNSVGVKNWIMYFEGLRGQRVELRFSDCSPAVVEQCNAYRNFLAGGTVISVQIPYLCEACKNNFVQTRTTGELKTKKFNVEDQPCPNCGKTASFDDLPDAYFGFLSG